MAELHNTVMGKKLIEHTLPEIARQLERIADALEGKINVSEQIRSAYLSHLTSNQPDSEIVKQLKQLWQK